MKIYPQKYLLEKMIEISKICQKILIDNFLQLKKEDIFYKNDIEICTKIDLQIQEKNKQFLSQFFPEALIICEEESEESNLCLKNLEFAFIIDPIDGTSNFINGLEFFAYSIGLVINGKIIGGCVCHPMSDKLFCGIEDEGAFIISNNKTEKINPIDKTNENNHIKHTNQKKQLITSTFPGLNSIAKKLSKPISFRILGSIALSVTYCVNQTFDGFFGQNCKIWDIAGGIGIIHSAGYQYCLKYPEKITQDFQLAIHNEFSQIEKMAYFFE